MAKEGGAAGSGDACQVRAVIAGGRSTATIARSLICSPRAIASRTSWPGAIAVNASDTSSAFWSGRPLMARISSPARMPATAAGPAAVTSSTVHRPGTVDSATANPSQPWPSGAGDTPPSPPAESVASGGFFGATGPGGTAAWSVCRPVKGSTTGSPIEMSPGSKGGRPDGAAAAGFSWLRAAGTKKNMPANMMAAGWIRGRERIVVFIGDWTSIWVSMVFRDQVPKGQEYTVPCRPCSEPGHDRVRSEKKTPFDDNPQVVHRPLPQGCEGAEARTQHGVGQRRAVFPT